MMQRLLYLAALGLSWPCLPLLAQPQAPILTSTSPKSGALAVPVATSLSASFTQELAPNVALRRAFSVFSQQAGGRKSGTSAVSGNTLTFAPTTAFRPGETLFATLGPGIQGINLVPATTTYVFQFTAATTPSAGTFAGGSEVATGTLPTDVALGDVDDDGDLDMLIAGGVGVRIWLNDGQGSYSTSGLVPLNFMGAVQAFTLGDVDGDSDLDLVAVSSSSSPGTLTVGLNNGQGIFSGGTGLSTSLTQFPTDVVLADVDGNGLLDVLLTAIGGAVSVRLNDGMGQGTFGASTPFAVGGNPNSVAVGDVDGDGDLDIATSNYGTTASVRLNNGQGTFSGGADVSAANPSKVTLGDVDGDGDLDLVVANGADRRGSTVTTYRNDGKGVFGSGTLVPVAAAPLDVVLGDVDGDGDLDLATANYENGTASICLNDSHGAFGVSTNVAVGTTSVGLALGDVDGNGTLDLVTANQTIGTASIRLNSILASTRINAGGEALATSRGAFAADQYYAPSYTHATTASIAGTNNQALYQTERYGTKGVLSYAVPVPNGTYSVVLHFAEIYWTQAGQRIFDVSLEGQKMLDNYDIVRKVGALAATTETLPVTVSDGVLNLDFSSLARDGGVDQAKISAIEVLPTTAMSYRLNAGSSDLPTSRGLFAADHDYSPTPGNIYSTSASIAGTDDPTLYQTERYSTNGRLGYALPVPNGTYSVVLHFAEIYWTQAGQRIFDVSLEGQKVLDNYDIVRKVGALAATTETLPVTVSDGVLNVDFSALASDGGVDQAKISAIEVLPTTTSTSRMAALASAAGTKSLVPAAVETLSLYPNPATDHVTLSCQVATAQTITYTLTDVMGRLVQQQNAPLQAGYNAIPVQVGRVTPGIYNFTLRLADGQQQQQRLVLQP